MAAGIPRWEWRTFGRDFGPADTIIRGLHSPALALGALAACTALFQLVIFAVAAARLYFGTAGLLTSGAVLGLTDVDALTISMTRAARDGAALAVAAEGIAIGVLVNCAMKAGLAMAFGSPRFRWPTAAVLVAMAAALAVALAWMR